MEWRSKPSQTRVQTDIVDMVAPLFLPVQVKLSQLCEQDKILKELEVKISSLKEDKVEPSVVGLIDSELPPAGVCLVSTDLRSTSTHPFPRTSWRMYWTFPASRWSSTKSRQTTPIRSPTSRGCCRRTWSPSGPRSPGSRRYQLTNPAQEATELVSTVQLCVCGVGATGDGPGVGGVWPPGEVSEAAKSGSPGPHEPKH